MLPAAVRGHRVVVVGRRGRRDRRRGSAVEVPWEVELPRPPAAAAAHPAAGDGGQGGAGEGQRAQGAAHRRRDGHCKVSGKIIRIGAGIDLGVAGSRRLSCFEQLQLFHAKDNQIKWNSSADHYFSVGSL